MPSIFLPAAIAGDKIYPSLIWTSLPFHLLIVVEGTDGAGKSTQINMLKRWIEDRSYGAMVSEWKTSRLISQVIDDAKERNLLNPTTFSLLYAADFADRLTNTIIPALEAGFVVLMDRYKASFLQVLFLYSFQNQHYVHNQLLFLYLRYTK